MDFESLVFSKYSKLRRWKDGKGMKWIKEGSGEPPSLLSSHTLLLLT
jgi:hypothetical protein